MGVVSQQLRRLYDALASSFWTLPAVMTLLAIAAALGSVALDNRLDRDWTSEFGWAWSGGPDGARQVLSVIASSVITAVSIVFSITITTLAQTSAHFGPRVLRSFTADRGVQLTLGTFVATFVYCLLVLRTVRTQSGEEFTPFISVNIGIGLVLLAIAVLIYFIHHISQMIQAENLIASVGHDLRRLLPTLFPEPGHGPSPGAVLPEDDYWQEAGQVAGEASGYLQHMDRSRLLKLACDRDLQLKVEVRQGEFVARGAPLLKVLPMAHIDERMRRKLRSCFVVGSHRTPMQDPLYALQQLVEIAAHALSPGINEPYTALTCVDWISTALCTVVCRELPITAHCDERGRLRLLTRQLGFEEVAGTAFDQIRHSGASDPAILSSLLQSIASLAPNLHRASDRDVLVRHVEWIGQLTPQLAHPGERSRVEQQYQHTLQQLFAWRADGEAAA